MNKEEFNCKSTESKLINIPKAFEYAYGSHTVKVKLA
jgi:hypothetical protein